MPVVDRARSVLGVRPWWTCGRSVGSPLRRHRSATRSNRPDSQISEMNNGRPRVSSQTVRSTSSATGPPSRASINALLWARVSGASSCRSRWASFQSRVSDTGADARSATAIARCTRRPTATACSRPSVAMSRSCASSTIRVVPPEPPEAANRRSVIRIMCWRCSVPSSDSRWVAAPNETSLSAGVPCTRCIVTPSSKARRAIASSIADFPAPCGPANVTPLARPNNTASAILSSASRPSSDETMGADLMAWSARLRLAVTSIVSRQRRALRRCRSPAAARRQPHPGMRTTHSGPRRSRFR